jgi:hypothetical protein
MYIAGTLMAFTGKSVLPYVRLPLFLKVVMFLKIGRSGIFIHIILYQLFVFLSYGAMLYFFISQPVSDILLIYNIYVRVSFAVLAAMLVISAIDAHLIEKGIYGRKDK